MIGSSRQTWGQQSSLPKLNALRWIELRHALKDRHFHVTTKELTNKNKRWHERKGYTLDAAFLMYMRFEVEDIHKEACAHEIVTKEKNKIS